MHPVFILGGGKFFSIFVLNVRFSLSTIAHFITRSWDTHISMLFCLQNPRRCLFRNSRPAWTKSHKSISLSVHTHTHPLCTRIITHTFIRLQDFNRGPLIVDCFKVSQYFQARLVAAGKSVAETRHDTHAHETVTVSIIVLDISRQVQEIQLILLVRRDLKIKKALISSLPRARVVSKHVIITRAWMCMDLFLGAQSDARQWQSVVR